MAIAGAERIFGLLDEEPEKDGGYVRLVNARYPQFSIQSLKILYTGFLMAEYLYYLLAFH